MSDTTTTREQELAAALRECVAAMHNARVVLTALYCTGAHEAWQADTDARLSEATAKARAALGE